MINAYSGLIEIELREGEAIYVDNETLVACESTMSVETKELGNMKTFFFGGEGIVFKLQGAGRVYIQTRNFDELIGAIISRIQK